MNETEIIAKDKAVMGKTIGIVRGLKGKTSIEMQFSSESVILKPAEGQQFKIDNALFNSLDTLEIVKIIEGHINGSN